MEAELLPVTSLPSGLVTSVVFHGASSTSKENEQPMISLCPSGRLLSFVTPSQTAQFLFYEGTAHVSSDVSYQTSYQGLLEVPREPLSPKPRPQATATLTIPIAFKRADSVQRSSIVVVGFSDGFVRGYSKSGRPVFSQLFHLEPVKKLTCMASVTSSQRRAVSNNNNLVVLYQSVVCVVEGGSLVELIKRNVANISSGGSVEDSDDEDGAVLSYKKWHLQDQTTTSDVTLLAHTTPSAFDYLCEASNVAGFDAAIRSAPVPEARLIAVGEQPMIALYKITKDAGQLNMSEVMHAVASKMTTAVLGKLSQAGGWLRWGGKTKTSSSTKSKLPEERVQLSSNLPMSTNVPDGRRTVSSITVSPLGNLAAAVDCFGRVHLLECESLVIRRMWKGYREAQCGWLLVHDIPTSSTRSVKRSQRDRKSSSTSVSKKKAQCLCIYAPRRGIVELWPVQLGNRIAAVQVGKGCQLLYSHHGVFTSESDESGVAIAEEERKKEKSRNVGGVWDHTLLLCPNGQLMRFIVPFPALVRMDDPSSHDAHIIQKLPQAIQSGATDVIVQVVSEVKSSQSLKQVIDTLISAYPFDDVIPTHFMLKVMNIAMSRMNETDSLMMPLYQFLFGVRQLVNLVIRLEELNHNRNDEWIPPSHDKLHLVLSEHCGMPTTLAKNMADILRNYFSSFTPEKRVTKTLSLKSMVRCFDLPSKVGNILLSSAKMDGSLEECESGAKMMLNFKKNSTLRDFGHALFAGSLVSNVSDNDVTRIYENCGIPTETLLSCLCKVFLVGNIQENNPCLLVERLGKIVAAVLKARDSDVTSDDSSEADLWSEVCEQCASSHNVGHALLFVLVCQHLVGSVEPSIAEEDDQLAEEAETWESLTTEREHWIRLIHHLEALTLLANIIGQKAMKNLPPAPFVVCGEEDEDWKVDVGVLQIELLSTLNSHKGKEISAVVLETMGPGLIAHCVSEWLILNETPPSFVAKLPSDPHDIPDSAHSKIVHQLSPLLKLLPHTLSHQSILVHSAWQAAFQKKYQLSLQFMSLISTTSVLEGTVGLLWHHLFESVFVRVVEALKRGTSVDDKAREMISVCRNIFGYLHQLVEARNHNQESSETPVSEELRDVLIIPEPMGKRTLMDIVNHFPQLNGTIIKTYFEFLLLMEIALHKPQTPAVNVVTFFPTWMRSAIKKGAYRSAWQDQVPVQLQQKRIKFLRESVSACLQGPVRMTPTVASVAVQQLTITTLPRVDVSEFREVVFLLGDEWALNGDDIRLYWVTNLFAVGLAESGKEVFLGIEDKTHYSQELLTLAGCLADLLINDIANKQEKLVMLAQTPPTLLEWLRKQGSSSVKKSCLKLQPNWKALSQLMSLIQPYLTGSSSSASANSICQELIKLIQMKK